VAVTLDAALGSNSSNGLTSVTVTTGAAAASGSRVFAFVSWFASGGAVMTVSGGGLTWSSVVQANNGSDRFAIWTASAPAGLASSSTITATIGSSGPGGLLVSVASFAGVGTIDTTMQSTGTTGASWTSGATANSVAGALFAGGAGNETAASTTSTPSNGAEIHDLWNTSAGRGWRPAGWRRRGRRRRRSPAPGSAGLRPRTRARWRSTTRRPRSPPTVAAPNPLLRMLQQGGVQRALALMLLHPIPGPADLSAAITALSDIDTGTGTEAGTVQATVPGSDTSTGTDTGTVSATFADTDSASGTDTQTTLSATVPGSDSATGTETSTGSITAPGSDSGTGTEAATTAVTLSDSDSGTGTDAQVSIVSPVAGSDTASGTEAGTVAATVPGSESSTGTESSSASVTAAGTDSATGSDAGSAAASVPASDSATGTEGSVVTETGPGGEGGAGSDTGTVSATVPGSDSGSGTDAGSVADITGGATPISGSDSASGSESGTITVVASDTESGAGTDAGTVVDLTPPVDTGPTGGADYGDESAIHGEPTRHLTGSDRAGSMELGFVVDLTPKPVRPPLRIRLPQRRERPRVLDATDEARAVEESVLFVGVETRSDMARGSESAQLVDITPEDPDEMAMVMALLFD
jgi:hypothetical protein